MEFEGVAGRGIWFTDLGGARDTIELAEDFGGTPCSSVESLLTASNLGFGSGGGFGEIETEVTLAEWA